AMPTVVSGSARFQFAGDQSLIVYFDAPGNKQSIQGGHQQVRRLLHLMNLEPVAGVRNLHPAYSSILFKFDALKLTHQNLESILLGYIDRMSVLSLPEPRVVEIPACYGGEYGPDLNDVAKLLELTPAQVIELHASSAYTVYFLGFVPGFAYLGELPESLSTPRLAMPRRSVPAGSVGIAGSQTGVYPISTPGGWRLIARTPLALFRPEKSEMSLLSIGDRVRFAPISAEQFAALERA
ncbi:MAG: 5-oxoprolinase subunit PxpB, partial [Candidatus Acidiferrum sp.]